jgi:general secretion pathway protein G
MVDKREQYTQGFTIVELALVLAIVGTLAGIALPGYLSYIEEARVAKACADIRVIEKEVQWCRLKDGELPESLSAVGRETFLDPWGGSYRYMKISDKTKGKARKDRFLVPINTDFDLYSTGSDGSGASALTAKGSHDDVIRAFNGAYVGLASKI